MSQENVEVIQQVIAAFNEGGAGSEMTLSFFAEDAVFEEPPEQPAPGVAQGREAVSELFGRFDETWEEHHSEPEEFRVIDDERVLYLSVDHFRGRDGIEIHQPSATLFTLREGKVTRMQAFWERKTGLEAAGLSE